MAPEDRSWLAAGGDDTAIRRAGLIHAGALGDFVLSLRIVEAMCRRFRRARIELLARSPFAALAAGRSAAHRTATTDRPGLHSFFQDASPLDSWWREYLAGFDLLIHMLGPPDSVVSRQLERCCRGRVIPLDPRHRPGWRGHITDQWLADLADAGLALPGDVEPRLTFSESQRAQARRRLLQRAGPAATAAVDPDRTAASHRDPARIVLVHPGSGSKRKCWPLQNFEQLAVRLAAAEVRVVFMLGPVEMDMLTEADRQRLARRAPVVFDEDLVQAASLVAAADVFVGNDAGMTHVAAAAGTPTVALFGPTEPQLWQPLGRAVVVVRGRGEPAEPFAGVDPSVVCHAVLAVLEGGSSPAG